MNNYSFYKYGFDQLSDVIDIKAAKKCLGKKHLTL